MKIVSLIAVSIAVLGCAEAKPAPKLTKEFMRYRAVMSQGGMTLPALPEAALTDFPSTVRLYEGNGFQVDAGVFKMQGTYRTAGDSIFLDQDTEGKKRLAFAGRLVNDTLHLHWIPDYDVGPDSHEADWTLSFERSR